MSRAVQIERSELRVNGKGNGVGVITVTRPVPQPKAVMVLGASDGSSLNRKEAFSEPEKPSLAPSTNGKPHNGQRSTIALASGKHIDLRIHPLAEAIPGLPPDEFDRLVEHFRKLSKIAAPPEPILTSGAFGNGQTQKILERDRYLACKAAGATLRFRSWDGKGSLAETVARLNLPRLHLTDSQRAAVAVPIAEQISAEQSATRLSGLRQNASEIASKTAIGAKLTVAAKLQRRANGEGSGGDEYSRSAGIAADICHVSERYVYDAKKIRDQSPELFESVRLGRLNIAQAKIQLHQKNSARDLGATDDRPRRRQSTDDLIIVGDCLKKMPELPGRKFNLIFADPPYNNGTRYDADPTRDRLSDRDYITWCKNWIAECARLLTPNGSLFILIDARYQGRFDSILRAQRDPPLHWRNVILWWEEFGTHQTTKFTNAARFIHYFTRHEKDFVWNADAILEPSKRQTEYGDSRAKPEGKVPNNVWPVARMPVQDPKRAPWNDPPQVPPGILERIVKVASNPGDRVFDPFSGNGTTGCVAIKLGREFLGIERSPKYAEHARDWIAAADETVNREGAKDAKVKS